MKDTEQADRFLEAARDVEADTSDNALDRIFGKLELKRKPDADDKDGVKKD